MEINFYNFKKKMSLSHELDISPSNLVVKSGANSTLSEINEDGENEVIELNLDETKDERINFLYDSTIEFISPSHEPELRLKGSPVTDLFDAEGTELIQYPANAPATLNLPSLNGTEVVSLSIPIKPAHEFMKLDGASREVLTDRGWLAACGMWNVKKYNIDSFFDVNLLPKKDTKDVPWLSKKEYNSRIKGLKEILNAKGIEVISTIYEKTVDINGIDINATGISRRKDKRFSNIRTKINNFLDKRSNPVLFPNIPKTLAPLTADEISPFDISIQSLQKAIFDDPETIFSDLISNLEDVIEKYNEISAMLGLSQLPAIQENSTYEKLVDAIDKANHLSITSPSSQYLVAEFNEASREFKLILNKAVWFENFNGYSVANTNKSILKGNVIRNHNMFSKLARILVPVDLGIKVTKVRNTGKLLKYLPFKRLKRYRYIKEDLGIRFVEIRFIDTSIFTKYRKNETKAGITVQDASGTITVYDLEKTNPDPIPASVNITYEIPHLPFDTELRRSAFETFGFFDQSKLSGNSPVYDSNGIQLYNQDTSIPGYEIFHETSKSISSLRGGMDIYKKTQFLISILESEFGKNRVKLIETTRSLEDQNKIQLGGSSSNFLSWHNYGLAIKVLIVDKDGINTIKEGSDDYLKLIDIAEIFTNGCYNGNFGTPINVVWCGRLKTGPDNFTWEFLPIGISHKDIWKFRDSIYNQIDPIVAHSYVDVLSKNMIYTVDTSAPHIRKNSLALKKPIRAGNGIWASPQDLRNYDIPSNLVLKDIQEYLFMVLKKIEANGSDLTENRNIYEWKVNNPISYSQLILYHSLLGNYNLVRTFLGMDYVDRFESMIFSASDLDPVTFVKSFLGTISYNNIKINVRLDGDGAYISPIDGKIYIPLIDAASTQPEGNGNTFGQKQVDLNHVEFIENGTLVSDDPVLTDKQLKMVHVLIKQQILEEYKLIKDSFTNLNNGFLYDSIQNGSNRELFDTLENEFGIIKTQDLITFGELKKLFNKLKINNSADDGTNLDGTTRGVGTAINGDDEANQSIFEKLISTTLTAGVQFVKPGKEKVIIEEIQSKSLEQQIKDISEETSPNVEDIL